MSTIYIDGTPEANVYVAPAQTVEKATDYLFEDEEFLTHDIQDAIATNRRKEPSNGKPSREGVDQVFSLRSPRTNGYTKLRGPERLRR